MRRQYYTGKDITKLRNLTRSFETKKRSKMTKIPLNSIFYSPFMKNERPGYLTDKQTKHSKETAKYKHLYSTGWQENESKCKKAYNYCVAYIASDNSSPTDKYLTTVDNFFMLCTNLKILA